MAAAEERGAATPMPSSVPFLFVALTLSALTTLLGLPLIAFSELPILLIPAIPMVVIGAIGVIWNTQLGLCVAAFAIGPLGIVQYEIAGVTLNLPEVLILALVAKEFIRFVVRGEKTVDFLPRRSLMAYLVACSIGLGTGLLRGNGVIPALQDLRQFTEFILLYLLVLHRVSSPAQVSRILACFMFGCVLLAAHGIFEAVTGIGIPTTQLLSDAIFIGGTRGGSFYGATPLGGIMVLGSGAAISLLLGARSRVTGALFLGALGICVAGAVFTLTRASWVALFMALVFTFFSIQKTRLVLVVVATVAMASVIAFGPIIAERLTSLSFSKTERSLRQRVHYYTAAWHIFRGQPVFGLGWGCYYDVQAILVNGRYVETKDISQGDPSHKATVHSAYLQILAKSGLLGLLSFLLFILAWARYVVRERRARNREPHTHGLFIGITAGLVGYLFQCAGENFFQWPVMSQSFYLLLACSTLLAARIVKDSEDKPAQPPRAATGLHEAVRP